MNLQTVGFDPDEFDPHLSTREARLKWVIVVDESLSAGRAVNAAVCVAAATSQRVPGLLGHDVADTEGLTHPGLPWIGCSILGAAPVRLLELLGKAAVRDDVFLSVMPEAAQETRVYAEYVERIAVSRTAELAPLAVSLVGPRNRVDRLVGGLPLFR